jgi:hypothetical protein
LLRTSQVWAFGITAMEVFTRGATPYRGWLNTFLIEQTTAGYRMPCPEGCPPEVYTAAIFPCWLPSDETASPRRPNFTVLCAELARRSGQQDQPPPPDAVVDLGERAATDRDEEYQPSVHPGR